MSWGRPAVEEVEMTALSVALSKYPGQRTATIGNFSLKPISY